MYRIDKLHQELSAQVPITGVRAIGELATNNVYADVAIDFAPEATEQDRILATQIMAQHDPTDLDAVIRADAEQRAASVPGWATMPEDAAIAWIADNVNDLASAKQAITALARMVIALRDARWPGLGG